MTQSHTCPLCGYRFTDSAMSACATCPLNAGCKLICCPNCGYQQPDLKTSRLARWLGRWFKTERPQAPVVACELSAICTLAECDPHQPACIRAFRPGISAPRRESLNAFGLLPGRPVMVLQQSPLTVVQVGAAELALETDLASLIEVDRGPAASDPTSLSED